MYQFFKDKALTDLAIDTIILTQDTIHQNTPFIFFRQNTTWFQIYFDENVLFITPILDMNFADSLQDLDLEILSRFFVAITDNTNLTFNVKNQTLNFENTTLKLMLSIENDSFKVVNFENFNTSKKLS